MDEPKTFPNVAANKTTPKPEPKSVPKSDKVRNPDGDVEGENEKYREPKGTTHSDQYLTSFPSDR